jgi:Spy/CpxP family protein refolding chaperone
VFIPVRGFQTLKQLLIAVMMSAGLLAAQASTGRAAGLKTYLGLSDTQVSSLQQIQAAARKEMQPLRETIQQKAKALRDQSQAGSTDAAALGQLIIDLRSTRQQLEPIRMRAQDQAKAVLTPDQQAKLAGLQNNAGHRRELQQARRLGLLNAAGNANGAARFRGRRRL